jgi:hypothetical protein
MIDATHLKAHRTASSLLKGPVPRCIGRTKGGLNSKLHAVKKYGFAPNRITTDKLPSYAAAARELGIECRHQTNRWANNRAENSHLPTRRRGRDAAL